MIRINMLIILLFICHVNYGQDNDSILNWSNRKALWSDFKGGIPKDLKEDVARISSGPSISISLDGDSLSFNVKCFMYKGKSWSITNLTYDLVHEQGHFDISEIIARKIRKYLFEFNSNFQNKLTWKELNRNVDSIANQSLNALQDEYDTETNFGSDTLKQKAWNQKISKMLNSLKQYTQVKGVLFFKEAIEDKRKTLR